MNNQLTESFKHFLCSAALYGGPGDGELVPLLLDDPMPTFPYLHTADASLAWYQLYYHPQQEAWQYVFLGMAAPAGWQKVTA